MGDEHHHAKLAREKRAATLEEFEKGRYTVVGDLAVKAVEQAIEALASKEGEHFHLNPRTAHAMRFKWVKERFPDLSGDLDELWGAYGLLGYDGADGEIAKRVVEAMERVIEEFERKSGIRLK